MTRIECMASPCTKCPSPFTKTLEMPINRAVQRVKGHQKPFTHPSPPFISIILTIKQLISHQQIYNK